MIYRRDGRPRSVQDRKNPDCRALGRNQWRGGIFPFQASLDGCTSLEQEGTTFLLQTDVGVDAAKTKLPKQSTSRCSRGVCETAEEPAAARGNSMEGRAN